MRSRKRNEWLDADESEPEDVGHGSDAEDSRRRALSGRPSKRQKFNEEDEDDDEEEDDDDDEDDFGDSANDDKSQAWSRYEDALEVQAGDKIQSKASYDEAAELAAFEEPPALSPNITPKPAPLSPKSLAAAQTAADRTGVIYISRVPPFMKPSVLKNLLSPYATKGIGRIFLAPEDASSHRARVRAGGNKKKSYTDGWVEFLSKRDAKVVAETLNARIVGGKKGGRYYDDVWNMRYLTGFRWHHLTDQIRNENAERQARMRLELERDRKEQKSFIESVEKAKMLDGMEAKRDRREKRRMGANAGARSLHGEGEGEGEGFVEAERKHANIAPRKPFRQNEIRPEPSTANDEAMESEQVKRVLSKIF